MYNVNENLYANKKYSIEYLLTVKFQNVDIENVKKYILCLNESITFWKCAF